MAKASPHSKPTPPFHYNMDAVEQDCIHTYGVAMKWAALGVGFAVVYFFVLAVYLGVGGHTYPEDFVKDFGDRIQIDYTGTKATYTDPATLEALPNRAHSSEPREVKPAEPALPVTEAAPAMVDAVSPTEPISATQP